MEAEIILMNICHEDLSQEKDIQQQQFLSLVKKESHYPKISCQSTVDKSIVKGLEKLCYNRDKDGLLSVIHKNRNFINEILIGSHTQKLAKRLVLPLLVLPPNIN